MWDFENVHEGGEGMVLIKKKERHTGGWMQCFWTSPMPHPTTLSGLEPIAKEGKEGGKKKWIPMTPLSPSLRLHPHQTSASTSPQRCASPHWTCGV